MLSTFFDMDRRPEVSRVDGGYEIEIDAPGFSRADLQVRVEGDRLVVSGTSKRGRSLKRVYAMGPQLDGAGIKAKLEDGVLTVSVPFSGGQGSRSVPIA